MNNFQTQINLQEVIAGAGIELHQRGNRWAGCCPFHADKSPSFYVFPDGKYHCFACQSHGDAIDFIRQHYGLSYPEALRHLGIEDRKPTPAEKRKVTAQKKLRELERRFRAWESQRIGLLGMLINKTLKKISTIRSDEDLDEHGHLLHELDKWQYHQDLLLTGDDESKFQLFREVEGV